MPQSHLLASAGQCWPVRAPLASWPSRLTPLPAAVAAAAVAVLQLMWVASELPGGKAEWRDMAISHATRTAKDFFRCAQGGGHPLCQGLCRGAHS